MTESEDAWLVTCRRPLVEDGSDETASGSTTWPAVGTLAAELERERLPESDARLGASLAARAPIALVRGTPTVARRLANGRPTVDRRRSFFRSSSALTRSARWAARSFSSAACARTASSSLARSDDARVCLGATAGGSVDATAIDSARRWPGVCAKSAALARAASDGRRRRADAGGGLPWRISDARFSRGEMAGSRIEATSSLRLERERLWPGGGERGADVS